MGTKRNKTKKKSKFVMVGVNVEDGLGRLVSVLAQGSG